MYTSRRLYLLFIIPLTLIDQLNTLIAGMYQYDSFTGAVTDACTDACKYAT